MTDGPADADDWFAHPRAAGEIRGLAIFFADLVDSTALSTKVEPETYRLVVGRYREQVLHIVDVYQGRIGSTKGDGLLAVFGHPISHDGDVSRAVRAGLEITREVARLSAQSNRRFGFGVHVRVGVHWGLVYLDTARNDFSGPAANLATLISGLAPPDAVVVSDEVEALVRGDFEMEAQPPLAAKGFDEPIVYHRVVSERPPVA